MSGNSDPGTSGLLSPFSDMNGLYFNPEDEVDDFEYRLPKDLERIYKEKGITYIKLDFDNKDDYYKALLEMEKMTTDGITMYGTSRENHYEIIFDKEDDADEDESEESSKEKE